MALTISVFGSTKIDETPPLGFNDDAQDDNVSSLPSDVASAFTAAGLNLASAIQFAGGAGAGGVTLSGATGAVTGLGFTDSSGGTLNGDASGLFTLDGKQIF